jgi:hypothetical protein
MMTQDPSGSGLYLIVSGPFKGLFTAEPDTIIPDEYLSDISNLHITELGALKSVLKPIAIDWKPNATSLGHTISSIAGAGTYIGQNGIISDNAGENLITEAHIGEMPVVKHLGKYFILDPATDGGLYNLGSHTKITAATTGFSASIGHQALAVYEMRAWLGIDQTLRGSANGQDLEAVDAVNGNRKVWGPWNGPNAQINMVFPCAPSITHLVGTHNGLLIFLEQDVFAMATFFGGRAVPIYHGADLPHGRPGDQVIQFPYTDGQNVYYASDRALFSFSGNPRNLSSALSLPRIHSFSCGEYNDRIWFLVCTVAVPTGAEVNYLYAINKVTGYWEKYDVQMSAKNGAVYNTPTALHTGVLSTGETAMWIGTSIGTLYDWYGTMADNGPLAWSFITKKFSPTFDQPHYPCKFRIDYVSQTTAGSATSPVTVTTYLDGTALATTITFDMAEGTGGAYKHREFDIPGAITTNSAQFLIEGLGHCEILNVGYSLALYQVGDTNP